MSHMIEPSPALSTVPPDFLTLDEAAAVLRVGWTMADHSYAMPQRTSHPIPRTRLVSEMPACSASPILLLADVRIFATECGDHA